MPTKSSDHCQQLLDELVPIHIRVSVTPQEAEKRGSEWDQISIPEKVRVIAFDRSVDLIIQGISERKETKNFCRITIRKKGIPCLVSEIVRAILTYNYDPKDYCQPSADGEESKGERQERERQEAREIKLETERKASELSALADVLLKARDAIVRSMAT